jgi:hypothetical protein
MDAKKPNSTTHETPNSVTSMRSDFRRNLNRAIRLLFYELVLIVCSCTPSSRHINWEYIIPDGYNGYLAIRFDCPNGIPLPIKDNTCRIEFAEDGTFCTSDKFIPSWSNAEHAFSKSGKSVPVLTAPAPLPKEYGIIEVDAPITIGGTNVSNPGPDMTLLTFWVGDMSAVNSSWPRFPSGKSVVLKKFGVTLPDDF